MSKKFYLGLTLFAVVVIVIGTAFRGPENEQKPVRQNWEYKIFTIYREYWQGMVETL